MSDLAERRNTILDFFANREADGYIGHTGLVEIAAKLFSGIHDDNSINDLRRILASPHGDMFWMTPVTLVTLAGRSVLGEEDLALLKSNWSNYTPYRGDTENHWLMYYVSMFIAAELYPGEPASFWFNGRSSDENHLEASEYIDHWIDLTVTVGQIEFDSPHYLAFFVTPLALLHGWAETERMRSRAGMMLDLILAGFAAESLDGLYAGAFSRIYPEPLMERWKNPSTTLAWLLFDNVPFRPHGVNVVLPRIGYRPHAAALVLAMSGYTPPDVLTSIATDRSEPYVHRERHRTRTRLRYATSASEPVAKTSYVTRDFILGSTQGGLIQPIQQHSWELFWATDDPHEGFNLLFTLHPYASAFELGMFFPEEPELLEKAVVEGEKPTYGMPDKWTGASPYEQIVQHENSLIVLYRIPEGTRYEHVSGFFSGSLEDMVEDPSGWIFCRGGRCLIAYYPLAEFEWRDEDGGHRRLHSSAGRNGVILHVDSVDAYASMNEFKTAVLACEIGLDMEDGPNVRFQTPAGSKIEATFGSAPVINGSRVDYDSWPIFQSKFANSPEPRVIELTANGSVHRLDFR
jgi:hypothetical protein